MKFHYLSTRVFVCVNIFIASHQVLMFYSYRYQLNLLRVKLKSEAEDLDPHQTPCLLKSVKMLDTSQVLVIQFNVSSQYQDVFESVPRDIPPNITYDKPLNQLISRSVVFIIIGTLLLGTTEAQQQAPIRMGVLLEGSLRDLASNYVINKGAGETEAFLNTSGNLVVEDISTYDLAYSTISDMADRGFNYFITGADSQFDAAYDAAGDHPECFFLVAVNDHTNQERLPSLRKNMASFRRDLVAPFYLLGYIAGKVSTSVGFVVPGPPVENYYSVNAFFNGARASNAIFNLSVVSTSSYNDHDTALGAINILEQDQAITAVTQSQDDMLVSEHYLARGLNAFGSNGFAQDIRYGSRIFQSIVYDYSTIFSHFAQLIKDGNWQSTHYYATFANGFYQLSDYSYLVPAEAQADIALVFNKLVNNETDTYCCSANNLEFFDAQCVSYHDMLDMEEMYSSVTNYGYYAVPTTEVYDTAGVNNTFLAVSSIQILCGLIAIVACIIFRNKLPIAYSNILFCFGLALGAILVAVAILLWNLHEKNRGICVSRIWMASLGYTFIIGLMIVKNTRIYYKFEELLRKKSDKISPITPDRVYSWLSVLLIIDVILLAIYTGTGDPNKIDSLGLDGIGKYEYTQNCVNNLNGDITLYIILVYHGLQLLYGCYISWRTRRVDLEEFEETHEFSTVTYLISFTTFIVVPLMAGITSQRSRDAIISSVAIFTSFSSLLILLGSKFWKIYNPIQDDGLPKIALDKLPAKPKGHGISGVKNTNTNAVSEYSRNQFLTAVANPTGSSAMFDD
ncbi:G-protein-coupled receptor family 3 protein 11 [Cavenderia fasciculata]|uniref:G-protein-coupled receptor family 3 protein 11 n=1 Tax=Cavenderia fasciculata TaxID=261658 RepID=F4PSR6_CACFS|nr:G-protein-coupled receptor family 3 protein 11 [Cavenderia fasciculata]EGG21544.1 G-protein-coupled receptor family 3 protein 11 [Cavenderia fasciculata]|eukprot:XP_004359394.1 G-protein-coupled receptor family 3 protein 11 [Cavenderia fasciculata]